LLLLLLLIVSALLIFLPARFLLLLSFTGAFDTPLIAARAILGLRDADSGAEAETEADHKYL